MGVRVRWHKGAYFLFVNLGGRRKAVKVGTDKRVANAAAAKLRKAITRGEYRIPDPAALTQAGRSTFKDYARGWIETCAAVRGVRPNTVGNHRSAIEQHLIPAFGAMPLSEIRAKHVRAYIAAKSAPGGSTRFADRPLSRLSLRNTVATLRLILQGSVEDDVIPANPARGVGMFKRPDADEVSGVDPFTAGELQAIIAAAGLEVGPHFATLVRLWAQSGLRAGELSALRWQDVDADQGVLTVRTTFSRRRLGPPKRGGVRPASFLHPTCEATSAWEPGATPLSRSVLTGLRRLPSAPVPEGFVFGEAAPLASGRLHKDWKRTLKAASVRYRPPENLRHTWASTLLSRGANVLYVQRQGGWRKAATLFHHYATWIPQEAGGKMLVPATQPQPTYGAADPVRPNPTIQKP